MHLILQHYVELTHQQCELGHNTLSLTFDLLNDCTPNGYIAEGRIM